MSVQIIRDSRGPHFILGDEKTKVRVEFRERYEIGRKTDLLARAIGYKKGQPKRVLDATAGLCRDSFHISCLGCDVTALERNDQLYEVVSFFVARLPEVHKLKLINVEALEYLRELKESDRPEVIYIDPMFPMKKKSARSSKEAELLKALAPIATQEQEDELVTLSIEKALQRVVVKRPVNAPTILTRPQIQFTGKAVRFDVYLK